MKSFSFFGSVALHDDGSVNIAATIEQDEVETPPLPPTPPAPEPTPDPPENALPVWFNSGEDKVCQDDLPLTQNSPRTKNYTYDGNKILLDGAKGETVAFCAYIEAPEEKIIGTRLTVNGFQRFDNKTVVSDFPGFHYDTSGPTENDPVRAYLAQYLQIKGISQLSYHNYDERHIPVRFQRTRIDDNGGAIGNWQDRPDHGKFYPDILVPLELVGPFTVAKGKSQAVWVDVYIERDLEPGDYNSQISISALTESGKLLSATVPIQLTVRPWALPDRPSAKTAVYFGMADAYARYLGERWPWDYPNNTELNEKARLIADAHFRMAQRHRIELFTEHVPPARLASSGWVDWLTGGAFTESAGYHGPGQGNGAGIFCIGAYGQTPPKEELKQWNDIAANYPGCEFFLYVEDEPQDVEKTKAKLAGLPKLQNVKTMVTVPPQIGVTLPIDIICSCSTIRDCDKWDKALEKTDENEQEFWCYNGFRPCSGTFLTEDDGTALRELAWGQYKHGIERWLVWASTYYNDYQGGRGATNVWETAQTFGGPPSPHPLFGETGWNYNNGDGVLFYPGTDVLYPEHSRGVLEPFASVRLKLWRRGLQDHDYLVMAAGKAPTEVESLVESMVPTVLWEVGVDNPADPTYRRCDISWPTDPAVWDQARKQLAAIIEKD